MEVLSRIRLLIWLLLLSLWGLMVYQYLGQGNFDWPVLSGVARNYSPLSQINAGGATSSGNLFPSQPQDQTSGSPPATLMFPTPPPGAVGSAEPSPSAAQNPSSSGRNQPSTAVQVPASANQPAAEPQVSGEKLTRPTLIPPDFTRTLTQHFVVYSEGAPPKSFLHMIELLHGNLMLDLAAFSPWAFDQRVTVVLFNNQKTYHKVTGRPEWSGGATSVERREIFVYESPDLQSIMAHEMTHVYYDGFYLEGHEDPMWLSEGMATFDQVELGLTKPNWLRPNLRILEEGGGYSLKQLMGVTTLNGASDAEVQLWYTEAYSVVRFLTKLPPRNGFYKFSVSIRQGHGVAESLLAGYGMPYNRIQALEYAWRFHLSKLSLRHVGESFNAPALQLNLDDQ
ncbi:MAG TPA: hypothetical protein VNK24_03895 [Elusimicrobiota bacterium]|nr:hypothetical protein [Elusimicrobiota bacterium]